MRQAESGNLFVEPPVEHVVDERRRWREIGGVGVSPEGEFLLPGKGTLSTQSVRKPLGRFNLKRVIPRISRWGPQEGRNPKPLRVRPQRLTQCLRRGETRINTVGRSE